MECAEKNRFRTATWTPHFWGFSQRVAEKRVGLIKEFCFLRRDVRADLDAGEPEHHLEMGRMPRLIDAGQRRSSAAFTPVTDARLWDEGIDSLESRLSDDQRNPTLIP